jgi:DNA polymerase-3 subunit delta'
MASQYRRTQKGRAPPRRVGLFRYHSRVPFAAIIGHAPLVSLLRQAVIRGRVPQSLLFAGPDGVGKRTTAIALAQAVNCPRQKDGDACGTCSTCVRIARGLHSDVTRIDKGDDPSIKIKTVRERVLETIGYRPFEAARRVYIIDPADELTIEAQDALLKTLEEPPPSAILVLVTAYPDALLPTIQSRCRRLRFGPLSEDDVVRVLVDRAGVDRAVARPLALISGGSVTRALAEQRGDFEDDREAAFAVLAAAQGGAVQARLKAAAQLAQFGARRRAREALGTRLALVATLLRDLGALRSGTAVPLANSDIETDLRKLSAAFDLPRVSRAFTAVDDASASLERNASPKIVADWVALTI